MTNQQLIDEIKAKAAASPFIVKADGSAIQVPGRLAKCRLDLDGFLVSVGFTYDLVPESGLKIHHLSIVGETANPVPEAIAQQIIRLVYADDAPLVTPAPKQYRRSQQFILVTRTTVPRHGETSFPA